MAATREPVKPEAGKHRRHGVGSDHADRRQPRHLHEDRLRQPRGRRAARATSSLFRGYSVFMKGKDPRDAHFITSRICGICGDNHAVCSCYAQKMAYGVKPPPLAEWIVNLGEAAEYIFDHIIFQDNLVFVDFCEQMVKETNPSVLAKAEQTRGARRRASTATRRSPTSCASYNPFTGETYREALHMSRIAREMFCLMEGRHVHPSTIYPGGVGTVATPTLFTDYLSRLLRCLDFIKKAVAMNDDVFDFFYEALPGYEEVGRRRVLLGCWGAFNNPDFCAYDYKTMDDWGNEMFVTPGIVVDGELVTTEPRRHQPRHPDPARLLLLRRLGRSEEIVRPQGPARQPGRQAPPVEPDDDPEAAEARPRRRQLLVGDEPALVRQAHRRPPGARHRRRRARAAVGDGAGQQGPHPVRQRDRAQRADHAAQDAGHARDGPRVEDPAVVERDRARPRADLLRRLRRGLAFHFLDKAFEEIRAGRTKTFEDFDVPDEAIGCGFHEAVRGVLSHHLVIRDGKIANYHPYPPTPWNGSPTDSYGTPGPVRGRVQRHADLRGERRRTTSAASTSCARCAPSTRACRAACTCTWATARRSSRCTRRCSGSTDDRATRRGAAGPGRGVPGAAARDRDRARAGAAGPVRRGARRGSSRACDGAGRGRARRAPAAAARAAPGAACERAGARARWTRCARTWSRTAAASSCSASTTASCSCGWRARATAARPRR